MTEQEKFATPTAKDINELVALIKPDPSHDPSETQYMCQCVYRFVAVPDWGHHWVRKHSEVCKVHSTQEDTK